MKLVTFECHISGQERYEHFNLYKYIVYTAYYMYRQFTVYIKI